MYTYIYICIYIYKCMYMTGPVLQQLEWDTCLTSIERAKQNGIILDDVVHNVCVCVWQEERRISG
jgi:hypothetical protein